MLKIYKYRLPKIRDNKIETFEDAVILSTGYANGKLCVWIAVETDKAKAYKYLWAIPTGKDMLKDMPSNCKFIGTSIEGENNPLVFHIFEEVKR